MTHLDPAYCADGCGRLADTERPMGADVSEELAALRALWWFLNDDFVQGDPDDGSPNAHVPWKSLVDLWDLHDAVEATYQRDGYPPKLTEQVCGEHATPLEDR